MSVNDDGVALKGGKGPSADTDKNNGGNSNIIIEDCTYGFCHGVLTLGSESIHNRNIILRRIKVNNAERLLWLKMRGDTPQNYEFITVEDIEGTKIENFLFIRPWTQFFDLKGQSAARLSRGSNVTMRNIRVDCSNFFNVDTPDTTVTKNGFNYALSNFRFEGLNITAKNAKFDRSGIANFTVKDVTVNGRKID